MVRFSVLAAIAAVAANESSCGGEAPSKVKDCQNVDLGSCGNACCVLDFPAVASADDMYTKVRAFLVAEGTDQSFKYVTGPDPKGHNPSDDLRQYNISWQYVWQGTHETTGGYVDSINFNVIKSGTGSVVRAFSVSNIHGALGDNGQNYKSIAYLLEMVSPPGLFGAPTIVHGCGK